MKYYWTWSNFLLITQNHQYSALPQKQRCPLTPTQIISIIFSSNTKQLKNWEVRSKAGLLLKCRCSAPTATSNHPKQPCCKLVAVKGIKGAEISEMFWENNPRKLKIQCWWADRGGLMPPEVLQRLDLSLSHNSTRKRRGNGLLFTPSLHTARKTKPALNKAPWFKAWSTLSFTVLQISNLLPELEEPKSWEYLQVTSMETPWLGGSDSRVEVRINSENSHLSSSLPAPPLFQQLLHQDR